MMKRAHIGVRSALLLAVLSGSGSVVAQPSADGIVPYRAVYTVLNDDSAVGESVHSLSYDASSGHYVFETRTEFRGLLRLASPRPLVERSEFAVHDGRIRPLTFTYEDGRRGGRNDVQIRFDWSAGRIVAGTGEAQRQWPLPADSLDRASTRVALMRDLAGGVDTDGYRIADPDEVRRYALRREGRETRMTALGELHTLKVVLQRPGSTRRTVTWAAPELRFLAVRIEQQRENRGPIAFEIRSVEWTNGDGRTQPNR